MQAQIPLPTFYMKDQGRGTCKNKTLGEDNRYKWNKATLTNILTRQEYCGDVVNFKTTKHFRNKRNPFVLQNVAYIHQTMNNIISLFNIFCDIPILTKSLFNPYCMHSQ